MSSNKCYLCIRVKPNEYIHELRTYGFDAEESRTIMGWIQKIYDISPIFFSGRSNRTIKASLAYIGGHYFKKEKTENPSPNIGGDYTQRSLADYFGCTEASLRVNYKRIMKTMKHIFMRHKIKHYCLKN